MREEFEGDVPLVEELAEQDLHDAAQNGGTIGPDQMAPFIMRVSAHYGGKGGFGLFCTLTKECQPNCN
ncbi:MULTISPECIES: plantaricin C family lantibiotic [Streptomyces]|uniref:Plantaricin C family lantibiotic n=1 Tax=Streptomyces lonegramiae TaxID=3075524 RepID=A0ABU2XVJ7_9ACTN|nr:plantaricin C family lantibiotic [Streptomyces sp. DSM 41529]MDT0549070.1 plantaricin C family lantibiotic [Streptomyces sp. DSM 41529]